MSRPLPVTLVSGFLGAGKTSVLHHLISEYAGGHLAILVEKTGGLTFDARALRGLCGAMGRKNDVLEEIDNAAELAAALGQIAQGSRHERVLMEMSGLTMRSYWERAFAGIKGPGYIESRIVVVDLLDFNAAGAGDARAFQAAQVKGAGVIVLNKCDLASDADREAATQRLRTLNPGARIIETAYGEVPADLIFRPAATGEAESSSMNGEVSLPAYESVVYRAQRPFHPKRFWEWFNAPHAGLARVKGIVWLATRNLLVGGVSRSGLQNSCGAAGIWWAALPREEWPDDEARLLEMHETWTEPYGDRRQELVLIGEQGRASDAARKLNLCLLDDAEFARGDWRDLPDPFPAWDLEE